MALKVVSIVDKQATALDRLARGVIPYHDNLDYKVLDFHPKRPSPEQLATVEKECRSADVIDYQYFRTAEKIREIFPWIKEIKSVLTHNNPYSITESDWNDYEVVVGNNQYIFNSLKGITRSRVESIALVADPYFWKYNEDYKFEKSVIMVANRIEAKKGILPVARACKIIGAKMYLVGAISDMDYFREIIATGVVEFAQQISDEALRELYYQAGIHVCNSIDNFESGTLPILEAMFCGVPVVSRSVGHVPDIKDGENIILNTKDPEDAEHLSNLLRDTFADLFGGSGSTEGVNYNLNDKTRSRTNNRRSDAWFTIKDRNFERRAYQYQRLYRSLTEGESVSVIMPVAEHEETTKRSVNAVLNQTHKNLELIVIDDGDEKQERVIKDLKKFSSIPLKYIPIKEEGYNLARARNLGIIQSTSNVIVFCDQRMVMEPDAVGEFLKELKIHRWVYGNKGAKKEFVENFSAIYRDDIVTLGMFNERCDRYGAMSQEVRSRAKRQAFDLYYTESAKATPAGKSSNRNRKKIEIMESKNWLWEVGLN